MSLFWAVDLGATSIRVMSVQLNSDGVSCIEELRYNNSPLVSEDGWIWNIDQLYTKTVEGLRLAAQRARELCIEPEGVAVDSWGVDVGIVDHENHLVSAVHHYRSSSIKTYQAVLSRCPESQIFNHTGVAVSRMNTLFQLAELTARLGEQPPGTSALLISDLWTSWLGGARANELTLASTTGLLSTSTADWDRELAIRCGVNTNWLCQISPPGSCAGTITDNLASRIGCSAQLPIIRTASHDTAAAVAAIPAQGLVSFISCGTWALVGQELSAPIVSDTARLAGFTNEIGAGDRFLFMRNLTGLWLFDAMLRHYRSLGQVYSDNYLFDLCLDHLEFPSFIDVAMPDLFDATDPLHTITDYCIRTDQQPPSNPIEFTLCITQSLALAFHMTLDQCEAITGKAITDVYMIGGGTRNVLLRQSVADASQRTLWIGSPESTSIGNALVQGLTVGTFHSFADARYLAERGNPARREIPTIKHARDRRWITGAHIIEDNRREMTPK